LVLALAALWLGRVAWRKHHHLVTLHARTHQLAGSDSATRSGKPAKKYVWIRKLDAKVTIEVKNMP